MFLSKAQARNLYNSGAILENRNQMTYVYIFQLCSLHFSSTERRAKKGNQYRLNNPYWKKYNGGLVTKLKMIYSGQVKLIKRKNYE